MWVEITHFSTKNRHQQYGPELAPEGSVTLAKWDIHWRIRQRIAQPGFRRRYRRISRYDITPFGPGRKR